MKSISDQRTWHLLDCAPLRLAAIALAATMAAFVLLAARQVGQIGWFPGPYYDKLVHATYYGTMAVLLDHGFARRTPVVAILLALGAGAADEIHQLYVPLREGSLLDWLADLSGALLFALAWRRLRKRLGG